MSKLNSLLIKELIKRKGFEQNKFAKDIGLSKSGLQYIFAKNTTNIETLELIAEKLNVNIGYFLEKIN